MMLGWDGGGWGGVNNILLDIRLHDDLFLLIASTVPRHTDALRLIFRTFLQSLIHPLIHSFIHSFSRASSVHSRGARAQPRLRPVYSIDGPQRSSPGLGRHYDSSVYRLNDTTATNHHAWVQAHDGNICSPHQLRLLLLAPRGSCHCLGMT